MARTIHYGLLLMILSVSCAAAAQAGYLGFDRNMYPGDKALPALRKTFQYTSFWLNNPPGMQANSWSGKRAVIKRSGLGFLVLFNGRLEAALGTVEAKSAALGGTDGKAAVAAAVREGFAKGVLIFLDQEEGGRLTPPQAAYLFAWVDAVRAAGDRAGVYCSGIMVTDESGPISTALDIADREAARAKAATDSNSAERLAIWIANDGCPPSPGCTVQNLQLSKGVPALPAVRVPVWQYAQSPRRSEFTASCPRNYAPDGNCYAPGLPPGENSFIDLNVADSADPSEGP